MLDFQQGEQLANHLNHLTPVWLGLETDRPNNTVDGIYLDYKRNACHNLELENGQKCFFVVVLEGDGPDQNVRLPKPVLIYSVSNAYLGKQLCKIISLPAATHLSSHLLSIEHETRSIKHRLLKLQM